MPGHIPESRVVSRGRRNTGLQFIRWGAKAQGLSWTGIETQSDCVQLRVREAGQVGLLRQVLTQKPIGVFVRAALPGTLWIAEVHLHLRSDCEAFMLGHLQTAIPSQ